MSEKSELARNGMRSISSRVSKIMSDAKKAGPATQQIAETIAKRHGAKVTSLNYKSANSIARKLGNRLDRQIKDAARTTIVANAKDIGRIIADLKKNPNVSNYKEHTAKENNGYTGHLFNLTINGVTTEIQVNTPEMIFAKENYRDVVKIIGKQEYMRIRKQTGQFAGWGHKFYEDYRTSRQSNPKRRKGNASAIDSTNYYKKFQK